MSETTAPGPTTEPPPPRRLPLRRSRTDRKIGGVAGGVAAYLNVDPLLVRVAFVVITICGAGVGLFLYVAALVLVPEEGSPEGPGDRPFVDRHGRVLAIIAAVLVASALLGATDPFGWGPGNGGWVVLVALSVAAVYWLARSERRDRTAENVSGPAAPGQPTTPIPSPSAYAATYAEQYAAKVESKYTTGPYATPPYGTAPYGTAPYGTAPYGTAPYATAPYAAGPYATPPYTTQPGAPANPAGDGGSPTGAYTWTPPAPAPIREPAERSMLGLITASLAAIVAGILIGIDLATDVSVPAAVVLASALAVISGGLIVGAFVGRARGLVGWAVALTVATALAAVVHVPSGSVGDVHWNPAEASDVAESYSWGVGNAYLDLTAVSSTTPVSTRVEHGVGELQIRVPRDATVRLTAHVGAGEVSVPTAEGGISTEGGFNRDVSTTIRPEQVTDGSGTKRTPAASTTPSTPTTFVIDARVGLGALEVLHASS